MAGAGLAPDIALLQPKYGSASSAITADGDRAVTVVLYPRLLRCGVGGGEIPLALHGFSAQLLGRVSLELEAPPGITLCSTAACLGGANAVSGVSTATSGGGGDAAPAAASRPLTVKVDGPQTTGPKELLMWLRSPGGKWRANRLVVVVG